MSNTPRTDAGTILMCHVMGVQIDIAKAIEHDLTTVQKERDELRAMLPTLKTLLDDCLIRIYPEEFTQSHIDAARERFTTEGGTIARIAHTVQEIRNILAKE